MCDVVSAERGGGGRVVWESDISYLSGYNIYTGKVFLGSALLVSR